MATVGHQHPPQQPATLPQSTQLEFHQAMRDFKTMFPEMDEDVIEVVLRANQGAVDATIDQLLAMSTDNENERLRTEMDATENAEAPPGYSPTTPPPTYQQAVPNSPGAAPSAKGGEEAKAAAVSAAPGRGDGGTESETKCPTSGPAQTKSSVPLRVKKNWSPSILGALPCDFLRITLPNGRLMRAIKPQSRLATVLCSEVIQKKIEENRRQRKMGHTEDPELAQYLEDERIALFLQNEEFMTELRSNKDFLTTLERDARSRKPDGGWPSSCDSDEEDPGSDTERPPKEIVGAFPYTKSFPTEESDAAFREKLKNMGKLSRRKFAQLARLFSRQKKRSVKQMYPYARLSEGAMPSKDNLLLDENDEISQSDDEDSNRPQNEYHLIKSSSSPKHHSGGGSSVKHD